MIEIEKVKEIGKQHHQACFYIGLKDGRAFYVVIYDYWHSNGTIRSDGKSDTEFKGFRISLQQVATEVFVVPYEVTTWFPYDSDGKFEIFQKMLENNLSAWDTYYTDRNPVLA